MKLILDFDDVLFNAGDFKKILFTRLEGYFENLSTGKHVSVADIQTRYDLERLKDTPFALKSFLKSIFEEVHESSLGVSIIYEEVMAQCHNCINDEVVAIVEKVGKKNCYIVTSGEREYQNDKIVRTGLGELVAQAIIVPGGKKEQIESLCRQFQDEEVIFVDDKNKYFTDIDMEVCKNLKTVLFNEHGLENLEAEITASVNVEQKRQIQPESDSGNAPRMR